MIAYLNGAWVDEQLATISVRDRGFLLADGVFETGRLVDGGFFRLEQHLDRFAASAAQLRLDAPPRDELRRIIVELARRNESCDASLRITLTRGPGGHGIDTRSAGPPTLLVTLAPMPPDWTQRAARGWHLITAQTRRPSAMAIPSQLKSLGRIYAILAHLEAEAAGVDDALLLTAEGHVAEGPSWNFFWRRDNILRTASLDAGVLEGVTRGVVMDLAREAGYRIEEGLWPPAVIADADEAFATLTSLGVVLVRSLDGQPFAAADCAEMLQRRYWEFVARSVR